MPCKASQTSGSGARYPSLGALACALSTSTCARRSWLLRASARRCRSQAAETESMGQIQVLRRSRFGLAKEASQALERSVMASTLLPRLRFGLDATLRGSVLRLEPAREPRNGCSGRRRHALRLRQKTPRIPRWISGR